ncbi:MAG: T9SS type A sorting domain-containing protein, partial [Bacteroidota bacterium]
ERGIQEIYHFWFNEGTDWDNSETSLYGPAPGFVAGGPNSDFSQTNIAPPANEPPMKSYKDWNTGWPEFSWEITEPAIYYQAAYIRNLAGLMAEEFTLPVTYQSPLTARAQAKTVLLEWRIAEEVNASHYGVEYLNDRDQWERIGRVAAIGASQYQFVHETPREGLNQYRLRQEDLDGTFAYSDIASVSFTDRFANIKVYPNPVPTGTAINLSNLPAGVEVRLYDTTGRLLHRDFLRGNRTTITTNALPTGIYSLELLQGREGSVWRQKVVLE